MGFSRTGSLCGCDAPGGAEKEAVGDRLAKAGTTEKAERTLGKSVAKTLIGSESL